VEEGSIDEAQDATEARICHATADRNYVMYEFLGCSPPTTIVLVKIQSSAKPGLSCQALECSHVQDSQAGSVIWDFEVINGIDVITRLILSTLIIASKLAAPQWHPGILNFSPLAQRSLFLLNRRCVFDLSPTA
jgi:hypothetical protein